MLIKVFIIIVLLAILYSLGSGLFYLVKDQGKGTRVAKALTWRIAISLALFIFLLIAFTLGWITPN